MQRTTLVIVNDTRYGRRKANTAAQDKANETGRKVYLQLERLPYPANHSFEVHIAADGRGPTYLGMPWTEFYPQPATQEAPTK